MTPLRANLLLLAMLTLCAIGLVTSQHRARQLVTRLEIEQTRSNRLQAERAKLEVEQRTFARQPEIEKKVAQKLRMHQANGSNTIVLTVGGEP